MTPRRGRQAQGIVAGEHSPVSDLPRGEAAVARPNEILTLSSTTDPWGKLLGQRLTAGEVQRILGLTTRHEVAALASCRRLRALPTGPRAVRFPAFQFTTSGEIRAEIPVIIEIFADTFETPHTIASWLQSPKGYLEGDTPIRWLERGGDPRQVIAGNEQAAARLAS